MTAPPRMTDPLAGVFETALVLRWGGTCPFPEKRECSDIATFAMILHMLPSCGYAGEGSEMI